VASAEAVTVDRKMVTLREGDWISLDGSAGEVLAWPRRLNMPLQQQ
jgi:hypothetical protein